MSLVVLAGCNGSDRPHGWEIRYSTGVKLKPPAPNEEFAFDFPLAPGSVHYISKPTSEAATRAVSAAFTIATRGDAVFDYHTAANNTCKVPAAVRLFLQRKGDDMSGKGPYEFYRWWSTAGVVLKDGAFSLDIPLEPARWTSVFGRKGDAAPRAFAAALSHLGDAGVTFGGGCFYGHGVWLFRGQASFTMQRFTVR